jgi:hypothetical protein
MIRTIAAAIAIAAAAAPGAASAVTFFNAEVLQGTGLPATDDASGSVSFGFGSPPYSAYVEFTVAAPASIFFTDITAGAGGDVSGVMIDRIDGAGGARLERFTTDTTFCGATTDNVAPLVGTCDLVAYSDTPTGNAVGAARPSTTTAFLAQQLLPGETYRLGLFESASPASGTVSFAINEVPLPPAGALMLASLVGLLLVRRRG